MVHVQDVLGLQMRVADRAVPPHWVPSRAHALAVDGAGVDGDGGAVDVVFLQELCILDRPVEHQIDKVGERHFGRLLDVLGWVEARLKVMPAIHGGM